MYGLTALGDHQLERADQVVLRARCRPDLPKRERRTLVYTCAALYTLMSAATDNSEW